MVLSKLRRCSCGYFAVILIEVAISKKVTLDVHRVKARPPLPFAVSILVPGGSVRGERANLQGLVLGCIGRAQYALF